MQVITIKIDKPEATNFVVGHTHFVKSVDDIREALVQITGAIDCA